jgi:DNA adenine methylase
MVELDENVAAVWRTILSEDVKWLVRKIVGFEMTTEAARHELSKPAQSPRERAFQTILKNRVCHGGIMAHGSGLIRYGENGKGIKSRWYPQTLKKRIVEIADLAERIQFIEGDGMAVMKSHAHRPDTVFFIDPPYTAAGKKAGKRLYKHNELDHAELFRITSTLAGDFLMTYDNAEGVLRMAERHGLDTEVIAMKNTHHAKMTELLVGRDLNWIRAGAKCREQMEMFG